MADENREPANRLEDWEVPSEGDESSQVVWQGGVDRGAPSRYDMTLDADQFPDGRYDLTAITADEVDELIDTQGGERRLDALLAIAEDAGVAAEEVALVQKVATQLIKQAIRAAKAVT